MNSYPDTTHREAYTNHYTLIYIFPVIYLLVKLERINGVMAIHTCTGAGRRYWVCGGTSVVGEIPKVHLAICYFYFYPESLSAEQWSYSACVKLRCLRASRLYLICLLTVSFMPEQKTSLGQTQITLSHKNPLINCKQGACANPDYVPTRSHM